ncbi:MAG TPA: type VI secretion system tip protein VgrG [Gammaproteobacteria bacterium]|nr:type VI secretion system tip protein VgrG [Gammaproteobacteria bacterium]
MATSVQAQRTISLATPLGEDVLLLDKMTATERLGRPFECELELLSGDEQIEMDDLLGQVVSVRVALPEGGERSFSGHVSRLSQIGRKGAYAQYRATLRPWLWFLTRSADCRIFQNKTVPDIIKSIFREHGFSDFDELLSADYKPWDYRVQYRETDFNFVSRLMEQEGIYYYFKHKDDKHSLVLSDSYSSHDLIPGYEKLAYYPPSTNVVREEHVFDWILSREIQSGGYALNDFDFEKPKAVLAAKSTVAREHAKADLEIYDYPGDYLSAADGEAYTRLRIEELQTGYEEVRGRSNARGLFAGGLFELANYPREDQNREYLITSVIHELQADPYESGAAEGGEPYTCSFVAIDSKQAYRSRRSTPKPAVRGPQTATVVGKSGEQIWTDKYGRVKVQFHWDRNGKADENSSCWVRVSQGWAGKQWGGMFVPHVGHEVLVSFLEGDPDRPIITGRVYNADNMPPEDLPANKEKSVVSDVAGNHLIMTSTKGKEQIHMFSPYGNSKIWIGAPNDYEGLGMKTDLDLHVDVDKNSYTNIKQNMELQVLKNRIEKVEGKVNEEIGLDWNTICRGKKVEYVVGPVEFKYDGTGVSIHGGAVSETFLGAKHSSQAGVEFKLNASREYTKNLIERTRHDTKVHYWAKKTVTIHVEKDSHLTLTNNAAIIKSGKSVVQIKKDGSITITSAGGDINVQAKKGNVNIMGDGQGVFLKGNSVSATSGSFKTKNLLDNG